MDITLAVVTQWIEHWPANQKVTSSIPSQGKYLGCGQFPGWGCVWGASDRLFFSHISVSLPFFLPPLPYL